jgi:hypothetical protein
MKNLNVYFSTGENWLPGLGEGGLTPSWDTAVHRQTINIFARRQKRPRIHWEAKLPWFTRF